jgi:hypothetical protein
VQNGEQSDISNNFTLQWAKVSIANGAAFVSYPITFVNTCRQISFTHWYMDGDWKAIRAFMVTSLGINKCYVKSINIYENVNNSHSGSVGAHIICVGY